MSSTHGWRTHRDWRSASLQRLLVAARNGRVDPNHAATDDAAALPPMPIVIEPITVAPLLTADIDRGAQQ